MGNIPELGICGFSKLNFNCIVQSGTSELNSGNPLRTLKRVATVQFINLINSDKPLKSFAVKTA